MTARFVRGRAPARLLALACLLASGSVLADPAAIAAGFAVPPDDARAMVRWWWFGPAVAKPQLEKEMLAMKAGGFGGVEIQPVYPMALDNPARGIRNLPYLSADFLDAVSFVNDKAHQYGLRVDMTLASGWPYGGPHVAVADAAGRLRQEVAALPAGAGSVALPAVMGGETLLAAFVGAGTVQAFDAVALQPLEPVDSAGRLTVAPVAVDRVVAFYFASRTGQQVKRAALGAEGFVLDHLSGDAVRHHLDTVAAPLLKAFGDRPPYAVFSDSLEVYNTDWTGDLLAQFRRRRGYDLAPHLPVIYMGQGPDAAALRHDWALTQTELVEERYLAPIDEWAARHGTRFRSQTYGEPVVTMSSNRLVALPEGEGPQWREFSFTRWATSAGHLYRRPVVSAETWTWLNSPAFAATPLDMKAEADRMLLQGVNQFVGHGWPYTPPGVPEPGYAFYAAAVVNHHQPWWNVMPDVNAYLQRMSYLLRQGEPANDIAVFLPVDDAYAALEPGKMSVSAQMHRYVTPALTAQILDAGHNLDYVDAGSVLALGVSHAALVLPHVTRLAPQVLRKLQAYVDGGGAIVAVGGRPALAPGFADAARIGREVQAAASRLFAHPRVRQVADDAAVGAALAQLVPPDLALAASASSVGFIRRRLAGMDIYFIANTGNRPVDTTALLRAPRRHAAWWNPMDGGRVAAQVLPSLRLVLAPYESRVLVLTDAPQAVPAPPPAGTESLLADLSRDWRVTFPGSAPRVMPTLQSWTDDPATRHVSAEVTYARDVELPATGARVVLDFGTGQPLESTPHVPAGMRAMLASPVREAAVVFVNGHRAGAVWSPPYRVDVTALLRAGRNHIEVRVANLSLNLLAGLARPDHRLLWARHGQRFTPQDTQLVVPQPSGLLGPVRLLALVDKGKGQDKGKDKGKDKDQGKGQDKDKENR